MKLTTIQFDGTRKGVVHVNPRFWERLSKADREWLLEASSSGKVTTYEDTRNIVYNWGILSLFDQGLIKALRLKGCCPKIDSEGKIPLYRGPGYVAKPLEIDENGHLFYDQSPIGQPQMGAFAETAEHEFRVAHALGPRLTDHAIGFGIFDELTCEGEKLGFTLFGQESRQDIRFAMPDINVIREPRLAYRLGATLAGFHRTHVHRYPHFGNVGIIPREKGREKVILRDLESCLPVKSLPSLQHFSYLFLDVYKVLKGYEPFCQWYQNPLDLLAFLKGYFKSKSDFNVDDIFSFIHDISYSLDVIIVNGGSINLPEYLEKSPLGFARFLYQRFSSAARLTM